MMTPHLSGSGVPPVARHFYGQVPAGQTSDPVFVNCEDAIPCAVMVFPGDKARIEYSVSSPDMINQGIGHWAPWDKGDVNAPVYDDAPARVSAIRCIAIGADAEWEVRL